MPKFKVEVRYSFDGEFIVEADSPTQAQEYIEKHCGATLDNIHSTLDDEDINWNFNTHPDTSIKKIEFETSRDAILSYYKTLNEEDDRLDKELYLQDLLEIIELMFESKLYAPIEEIVDYCFLDKYDSIEDKYDIDEITNVLDEIKDDLIDLLD